MAIEINETSRGRVLHFTHQYKTADGVVMVDRRCVALDRIIAVEELDGGDPMIVCEHNYFFRVKDAFAEVYAAVYG